MNSLITWEHARRSERWLRSLTKTEDVDIVWRMHPYGGMGYPQRDRLKDLPLVVGPMFYAWPAQARTMSPLGRPRFGVGLGPFTRQAEQRGWDRALKSAALLICSTEAHAAAMAAKFSKSKVIALPVIVEPPQAATSRVAAFRSRPFRLIFVANLLPYKNPILFCRLVKQLVEQGFDVEGDLIGEGTERAVLRDFIQANGFGSRIRLLGRIANSDVYPYLANADLLVSLSEGEPYGRSIAEAMSVGTPCLCHRSGGPADFIHDGVNGLLVGTFGVEPYAERIAKLIDRPEQWGELSANALLAAGKWTPKAVLDVLEAHLLEVREDRRAAHTA